MTAIFLPLGCPADGFVCPDLHVVEGNGTLEAVLVTSTASLVRTTTSGYLDLVSTVSGKVGSAMCSGTCHTAIPFIVWAIANCFFPHPEETWTHSKEHKRMIQSTQRKMLRLIIGTKRKYKTKTQCKKEDFMREEVGKQGNAKEDEEKENNGNSEDETNDGHRRRN